MAELVSSSTHLRLTCADITDTSVHPSPDVCVVEVGPLTLEAHRFVMRAWLLEVASQLGVPDVEHAS